MKVFLRRPITKFIVTTLLIAGVILLCPVNSLSSSAIAATTSVLNITAGDLDHTHSQTHSAVVDHVANFLRTSNESAILFFATIAIFFLFLRYSFFLASRPCLAKLKYFRLRFEILIKSKIEKVFLHWLNLLGGTFASSF